MQTTLASTVAALRPEPGPASRLFDVVIFDVDGSQANQRRLVERYRPTILSLRERAGELRNWIPNSTMRELRRLVEGTLSNDRPRIAFSGANDYHHLAYLWISLLREPVTVIGFDSSTDVMRSMPGEIWAGSWTGAALKHAHVRRIVQIGTDRDLDLSLINEFPLPLGVLTHELGHFRSGRFEAYPKFRRKSRFLGRVSATNPSVVMEPDGPFTTHARWRNLHDNGGIEAVLDDVLRRAPTDAVYITIDKDGLHEAESFTNVYDGANTKQGDLTVEELLAALRLIKRRKRIVGVDVVGDFSYPETRTDRLKWMWAEWQFAKLPASAIDSCALRQLNEDVNLRILEVLME